jgi:hypothetical protein
MKLREHPKMKWNALRNWPPTPWAASSNKPPAGGGEGVLQEARVVKNRPAQLPELMLIVQHTAVLFPRPFLLTTPRLSLAFATSCRHAKERAFATSASWTFRLTYEVTPRRLAKRHSLAG